MHATTNQAASFIPLARPQEGTESCRRFARVGRGASPRPREGEPRVVRRPADHLEGEAFRPLRSDFRHHRAAVVVIENERVARQLEFAGEVLGVAGL